MPSRWIRILLLATFAFWATGTARYAHIQIEHHGHDQSMPDADDDDSLPIGVTAAGPADNSPGNPDHNSKNQQPQRPCVICQTLAAMAADRPPVPPAPIAPAGCVAVLPVANWSAPALIVPFFLPARGPPAARCSADFI